MTNSSSKPVHKCRCSECVEQPSGEIALFHTSINRLVAALDEKHRRQFVGLLASQLGHSGIQSLSKITGLHRETISRGKREIEQADGALGGRIRASGGGRHKAEKKPGLLKALEEVMVEDTAGDPISGLKWTHKSLRKIQETLDKEGYPLSPPTISRLLQERDYSLQVNHKRVAGKQYPDRDAQFRYIVRWRRIYLRCGGSVISVDAKKRELIGNFKNSGRAWRQERREVNMYDFPSLAQGKAIPYGIYDIGQNQGFVAVGTSHNTPEFAVAAIRGWRLTMGQSTYPDQKHLLIEADSGNPNSSRSRVWKVGLQQLADEFGLTITVTHYPTGASKWNPIEHPMFNLISANWAGEPLDSYETILNHIRTTTSTTGFWCQAQLDTTEYELKKKVANKDFDALHIRPHKRFPQWNYTIYPRTPKPDV